ncbi:MAG: winged helix-turn-helix domain-containing protein, partial [Glaciecola sp.]
QFSSIPVIMLTAKGDDFDRILGLELGADDYLPKPFNQRELVARIKALTRRYVDQSPQFTSASAPEKPHLLSLHNIVIDIQRLQASINQQNVALTATELHMLHYLMLNAGKVITKDTLSQAILHRRLSAFDRSLDMHVSNIRKKLALHGVTDVIKTMRGVGYLCQIEEVQA